MNVAPVAGAVMSAVLCAALAPRFFAFCDRRIARTRLTTADLAGAITSGSPKTDSPTHTTIDANEATTLSALADHCRSTARRIAAGMPPGQAFECTARVLGPGSVAWRTLGRQLSDAIPLEAALRAALEVAIEDDRTCLEMIHAATVDRHLAASQLDHVALVLDETDALRHEVAIGAAHAIHTARMLTWLPVAVLILAATVSDSLRLSWNSPAVLVPVCLGGALNLLGRGIVSRAIARTVRLAHEHDDSPARIADCLGASLSAGLTVDQACARLDCGARAHPDGSTTGMRAVTASRVRDGDTLERALADLQAHPDTRPIAEVAVAVARDGLAGAHAAAQLGAHARSIRRVRTRTAVARLPSTLAIPVTLLFLPAFIIGAVVPVVTTGSPTMRPLAPEWSTHGGGE